MDRWMRFAIDRKRQTFTIIAALMAAVMTLIMLFGSAWAKTYVITDGGRVVTYTTFATDPAQVLGEAGLRLEAHDTYTAGGSDIHISRAQRVTVSYYGNTYVTSSLGETVEELLKRLELMPGEGDMLSHSLESAVWEGMEIRIDRVFRRQETYTATIAHDVIYCDDPSLPAGSQEVLIPGVDGELLRTAEVTYTNDRETHRQVLTETMTLAPVAEIVAVGTGESPPKTDPEAMPVIGDGYIRLPTGEVLTYYDSTQVRATAYTHTDAGCDFITYTGTRVRIGTVAVDPRYIPYGTRMFIVSNDGCYIYGISVAEDCGGAIKGDRIDLYFPTYNECIQFGRRDCTIYFLG